MDEKIIKYLKSNTYVIDDGVFNTTFIFPFIKCMYDVLSKSKINFLFQEELETLHSYFDSSSSIFLDVSAIGILSESLKSFIIDSVQKRANDIIDACLNYNNVLDKV